MKKQPTTKTAPHKETEEKAQKNTTTLRKSTASPAKGTKHSAKDSKAAVAISKTSGKDDVEMRSQSQKKAGKSTSHKVKGSASPKDSKLTMVIDKTQIDTT